MNLTVTIQFLDNQYEADVSYTPTSQGDRVTPGCDAEYQIEQVCITSDTDSVEISYSLIILLGKEFKAKVVKAVDEELAKREQYRLEAAYEEAYA